MTTPDPIAPQTELPPQPPPAAPSPAAPAPAASQGPSAERAVPVRRVPSSAVLGILLVTLGVVALIGRLAGVSLDATAWPVWVIVPGLVMLVASFLIPPRGGLGLAIPGAIITMVGLVLWFQEAYGLFATWAYAWALVAPTGPGLGMLIYGGVHRDRDLVSEGLRMTLVGLGLFIGFAIFFEGVVGLSGRPFGNLDQVLPYAAIGFGALLVVLSFVVPPRRRDRPV
jgi:hypothetical protein